MRQSAKVGMYEALHRCVQVFARATNTIEQFAMQQKCFGRAEILCKVPFVKCMQVRKIAIKMRRQVYKIQTYL